MSYFDEVGYLNISKVISEHGLFSIQDSLRTYLYPLIISLFSFFSKDVQLIKIYMSIFQYSVYVFTIIYIANTARRVVDNKITWFTIIILGLLNPYIIQSTTLLLTDLLATCCIILAFTYFINSNASRNIQWIIIFGLSYSAVMIRPSSLIFIPILFLLILYRYIKYDKFNVYKVLLFSFILLIIFYPQLSNNVRQFNHWTPLIHESLYSSQSVAATQVIKYGTVIIPYESPQLYFISPVLVSNGISIYKLIFENFFYFLVLYTAHIFGVFDWGYVDSYIKDFYPFTRIPASILLYLSWILIFIGIFKVFMDSNYREVLRKNTFRIYSLLIATILYILFIATTMVESRFGYPIFLFLLPFSGYGLSKIIDLYQQSKSKKFIFKYLIISFVAILLMMSLSFLSDSQTNKINWFAKFKSYITYEQPELINRRSL